MKSGFALLGALISILVLAILGTGVTVIVSRNNQATISQISSTRSLYALQAGIEFAQRKLRATGESVSINTLAGTYEFGNNTFTITNGGNNTVIISGSGQDAFSQFTLDIPQVNQGTCLIVQTDDAAIDKKKLIDITLQRDPLCSIALTITALKTTWTPDNSEKLDHIQIEKNPVEYDSKKGITSGQTATFSNTYTINNTALHTITEIRWDVNIGPSKFDFLFTMSDGTTKALSLDLSH